MKLCIVSKENTTVLLEIVEQMFSGIINKEVDRPTIIFT